MRFPSTAKAILLPGCVVLAFCSAGPARASVPPAGSDAPPALVNGQAVQWSQLRDLLAETAGAAILEEVVLDRLLTQRLVRENKSFDPRAVDREQSLLLEILDRDPTAAAVSLEALRQRRALGDRRFDLMLRRNAMLRLLIQDDVEINETMIRSQYEQYYGPQFRVRLITASTMNEAATALGRIHAGEPFGEVAALVSSDTASAQRGGLLDPISPYDASYPAALRQILADLDEGDLSPIIPIESDFAIVQMIKHIPARDIPFEMVKTDMERSARLAQERILMDNLARQLLASADIVVLDPALSDGWKRTHPTP